MSDFQLVEPFDIDDNSLEGLSPQQCFVMGVEWEMFRRRLATGNSFVDLCHAENAGRFTKMAERQNRFIEVRPAESGWASLAVGDFK